MFTGASFSFHPQKDGPHRNERKAEVIDSLNHHGFPRIGSELEIAKSCFFLRRKEFDQAIQVLKKFERSLVQRNRAVNGRGQRLAGFQSEAAQRYFFLRRRGSQKINIYRIESRIEFMDETFPSSLKEDPDFLLQDVTGRFALLRVASLKVDQRRAAPPQARSLR